jgi:prepilin-type N-terminal cleavage/methylation domain-containing protein
MRRSRKARGLTLIEMVVVIAIGAALAAIVVPIVADELVANEQARAFSDCQRIAAALTQYVRDTRQFPTGPCGDETVHFLAGEGNLPATNPFLHASCCDAPSVAGVGGRLADYVTYGAQNGGARWRGPYLASLGTDPWGNAYLINVHGYFTAETVWVLSAGPNGVIDTQPGATKVAGDDVGLPIQ